VIGCTLPSLPVSLGIVAIAGLVAAIAIEPLPPSISWEAPSVCPSPSVVSARLTQLLGGGVSEVRADARVRAEASGWRLDLELHWRGRADVRTIVADRCETLADATVLLVATTADPVMVLRHVTVEPTPPSNDTLPNPVAARTRPLDAVGRVASGPAVAHPRVRDRGPTLGLMGLVDLGSLPRLTAGVGATVGWRWSRARLFAEGSYLPERRVIADAPYARQGRVQLGTARAGACVRLWLRDVELPLCGGAEAGGTRATGFGVRADLGTSDPWFALFAHGGLAIPLMPSLAVVGRIEGAVPLVYSEYVHGNERLYRAWPVVVRGGLGLEFRWGQRNATKPENPRGG
jgi:hypothetical protein